MSFFQLYNLNFRRSSILFCLFAPREQVWGFYFFFKNINLELHEQYEHDGHLSSDTFALILFLHLFIILKNISNEFLVSYELLISDLSNYAGRMRMNLAQSRNILPKLLGTRLFLVRTRYQEDFFHRQYGPFRFISWNLRSRFDVLLY